MEVERIVAKRFISHTPATVLPLMTELVEIILSAVAIELLFLHGFHMRSKDVSVSFMKPFPTQNNPKHFFVYT
jgi:hypothetical protein